MKRVTLRSACTVPLLFALACSSGERGVSGDMSSGARAGGTLIAVVPAEPTTLFPPLVSSTQGLAVVSALFDRLAEIGPALETFGDAGFEPRLASSWQWASDSLSIAFALNPAARWHDGAPVRAADVQFTFRVYTSDSVGAEGRSLLGNIDSVSVPDSLTAVFWFKRRTPQQFYDATYHMWPVPSHLLGSVPLAQLAEAPFARQPVGSGRFRFARWDAGQRIEIIADTTHVRGRALLDRVIWSIAPDFGAATVKLFAGEADFFEMIRPDNFAQVVQNPTLRLVDNRALSYNFLGFNLRDPDDPSRPHRVFGDVAVRRALTMAVDRDRLVRNVFDSLGLVALAPAPRALIPDTAALRPIPYDLAAARALLDSAGWQDRDGDGVRERDGIALAFTILVPSSSAARQRYAVLLQEQYRVIGARATPLVLDVNAFVARTDRQAFDAQLGGFGISPGLVGLRQTWSTTGAANAGGYASPAFDALVDSALTTFDASRSRGYWARAFQQAIDDAPAVWLYEQRTPVAIHRRFIVPTLRPDGWYANLADWRIDPSQAIERDRIGLGRVAGAAR